MSNPAESTPNPPTYDGNCHCGLFKFRLTVPRLALSEAATEPGSSAAGPTKTVISCNCSMCASHGLLMIHCDRNHMELLKGYEQLAEYHYRMPGMVFKFCPRCGTSVMWDVDKPWDEEPEGGIGVNARTLQGVDLEKLKLYHYDGRSQGEPYVVPD